MIVELYGLPGSGKTTMAKEMEKDGFVILKIRTKKDLIFYNLLFFTKHSLSFLKNFVLIVKNSDDWRMFYYKLMNCFLHYNAKYEKAGKYEKVVIDQGHFQNILSVFNQEVSEATLKEYIKNIPQPDKLIVFDLLGEEWEKRVRQRGYLGRESFGDDHAEHWKEIMEKNDLLFKKVLKEKDLIEYKIINQ